MTISLIGLTVLFVRKAQQYRYQNQIREIERQFAIEKERLRISKDMHDEVGASLTRISILSELAKKQQNNSAATQQIVDQISEISGNVVDEMSEIIWAMNPRNDTLDSFTSYIRQYASTYLETAGINGEFRFPDEIPSRLMSSELRRNLFLTIKEALHNIVKHSVAENVNFLLHFNNNVLRIEISDNGKGFTPGNKPGIGNGLINMHRRLEDINGQFAIDSVAGKGTKIELSVSLLIKADSH
jgi:signal transduction histidine kinase